MESYQSNKKLSKEALKKIVLSPKNFTPIIERVFTEADLNCCGFIDASVLSSVMKGLHEDLQIPEPTETDIQTEMKRLNINRNGKISKDEFEKLVKELISFIIDSI